MRETGFGSLTGNKQINIAGLRGPVELKNTESKILFSASVLLADNSDSVA